MDPEIKGPPRAQLRESHFSAAAARPPAMACPASAPVAPGAALFWDMLALLTQEPGMEWLELSLAGQAVTSAPRSREAPRNGKCGPGPDAAERHRIAGGPASCRAAPWYCSDCGVRLEGLVGCVGRILPPGLGNNVTYWRECAV